MATNILNLVQEYCADVPIPLYQQTIKK